MEVLYKRLYDKYNTLKAKRISQLDQGTDDQEKKIMDYLTAADACMEELRGENDKLRAYVGDLQNELVSLSISDKDHKYEDSQTLLSQERQKNEELTKQIDYMLKLQREDKNQIKETDTAEEKQARKSRRLSGQASVTMSTERVLRSKSRHSQVSEPSVPISTETIKDHEEPQFCRSSNNSGSCNCPFGVLVECFTGLKVSIVRQTDDDGISALHQSSGYSFKLTWLKKSAVDETQQLLYEVSSLGTLERIAPEWMREAIIFSMNMCPVFFERVSGIIKHHGV